MATSVEVKKAISELENTNFVNNGDLLMLSRVYGALGNYHSYNVNVEDFLSSALSDYHDIKCWVWQLINNLSSKVLDEKFVHKIIDDEKIYKYEYIDGGKIFNDVPSCMNDPQNDNDLIRKKFLDDQISNLSNQLLDDDFFISKLKIKLQI